MSHGGQTSRGNGHDGPLTSECVHKGLCTITVYVGQGINPNVALMHNTVYKLSILSPYLQVFNKYPV